MSKKKFYVVWNGRKKGVFTSWKVCKKQIDGFEGAQYKSFANLDEAEIASKGKYEDYKGKNTKKPTLSAAEKKTFGKPNLESISVDAACAGNPGKMEYRGVLTHNKKEIFRKGPFKKGTNNVTYNESTGTANYFYYGNFNPVLITKEKISLSSDKSYRAKLEVRETQVEQPNSGHYEIRVSGGSGYTYTVVKTAPINELGFAEIITEIYSTVATNVTVELWLITETDQFSTGKNAVVQNWDLKEFDFYPQQYSEIIHVCQKDCCDGDIELRWLNKEGGMDKIWCSALSKNKDKSLDRFFHELSCGKENREFSQINNRITNSIVGDFNYENVDTKQKVIDLIESSDVWVVKDNYHYPVYIESGSYKYDESGSKVYQTVKIIDGYGRVRQNIS